MHESPSLNPSLTINRWLENCSWTKNASKPHFTDLIIYLKGSVRYYTCNEIVNWTLWRLGPWISESVDLLFYQIVLQKKNTCTSNQIEFLIIWSFGVSVFIHYFHPIPLLLPPSTSSIFPIWLLISILSVNLPLCFFFHISFWGTGFTILFHR